MPWMDEQSSDYMFWSCVSRYCRLRFFFLFFWKQHRPLIVRALLPLVELACVPDSHSWLKGILFCHLSRLRIHRAISKWMKTKARLLMCRQEEGSYVIRVSRGETWRLGVRHEDLEQTTSRWPLLLRSTMNNLCQAAKALITTSRRLRLIRVWYFTWVSKAYFYTSF